MDPVAMILTALAGGAAAAAQETASQAVKDAYKRLLCLSMETETRLESKKRRSEVKSKRRTHGGEW